MKVLDIQVSGMTCGGCVNSVTRALKSQSGVDEVTIILASGMVTATYNESITNPVQLKNAIIEAGYSVNDDVSSKPQKGGCCC